jgi:hypothetical protein
MNALDVLAVDIGLAPACAALGISRAGIYRDNIVRRRLLNPLRQRKPRPRAPLALSQHERQAMLEVLCSERFADCAGPGGVPGCALGCEFGFALAFASEFALPGRALTSHVASASA